MPKPHECALYFALRAMKQGMPKEGDRFTCPACGRSYVREGFFWTNIATLDDLKDMVARDPRGHLSHD